MTVWYLHGANHNDVGFGVIGELGVVHEFVALGRFDTEEHVDVKICISDKILSGDGCTNKVLVEEDFEV